MRDPMRSIPHISWTLFSLLVLGGLALLSGCADLAYYRQAAAGQWEQLRVRQPVAELLADPATDPDLRRRLATAQALRDFASAELALPDNRSYRDYADLQRPWVVKNVFAAPELSLEPRRWCFLITGCLSYRGYFDAAAAQRLVDELRDAGDDVYLAEISAYSTLGWFADPLLNTFIRWPTGRLAELLFHELAHQRLYIANDTAFNEAFATAVGQLGAVRWLEQYGSAAEREEFAADLRRREAFLHLVTEARARLATLYDSSRDDAEKRVGKHEILADLQARYQDLKQDWDGYAGYDRWFARDLNNAKLAGVSTYYHWVPAFVALFEQERQDFAAFYQATETLGRLPPKERAARLEALLAMPDAALIPALRPLEGEGFTDRLHGTLSQ
jgi:predicted aminopeptidase